MFIYQRWAGLFASEKEDEGYKCLGEADTRAEAMEILRENYSYFAEQNLEGHFSESDREEFFRDFVNANWRW